MRLGRKAVLLKTKDTLSKKTTPSSSSSFVNTKKSSRGCTKQIKTKKSSPSVTKSITSTTGKKKMNYLEDILQNDFGNYIKQNYPGCIINGCPAGAHLGSWKQRGKVKDKHYRKGWPDMFIAEARGGFFGFFIELKVGNNKLSDEQLWTLKYLYENGYKVACINNLKDACDALDAYLREPHTSVVTEDISKKQKIRDARNTNAMLLKFRQGHRGENKEEISKMAIISPKLLKRSESMKTIEDYFSSPIIFTKKTTTKSTDDAKKTHKSARECRSMEEIIIVD